MREEANTTPGGEEKEEEETTLPPLAPSRSTMCCVFKIPFVPPVVLASVGPRRRLLPSAPESPNNSRPKNKFSSLWDSPSFLSLLATPSWSFASLAYCSVDSGVALVTVVRQVSVENAPFSLNSPRP